MDATFREGHYVLGIAGLALLRAGADRRLGGVDERVREIRAIAESIDEQPYADRRDLPEQDVGGGYAGWASSYDDPGNDTIELEQPAVLALLEDLPPGPVLDATGARSMIPEHPHLHGAYVEAFAGAGLTVRRCLEPCLSREGARQRVKAGRVEAFEQALAGVPAVLIWEAERPQAAV